MDFNRSYDDYLRDFYRLAFCIGQTPAKKQEQTDDDSTTIDDMQTTESEYKLHMYEAECVAAATTTTAVKYNNRRIKPRYTGTGTGSATATTFGGPMFIANIMTLYHDKYIQPHDWKIHQSMESSHAKFRPNAHIFEYEQLLKKYCWAVAGNDHLVQHRILSDWLYHVLWPLTGGPNMIRMQGDLISVLKTSTCGSRNNKAYICGDENSSTSTVSSITSSSSSSSSSSITSPFRRCFTKQTTTTTKLKRGISSTAPTTSIFVTDQAIELDHAYRFSCNVAAKKARIGNNDMPDISTNSFEEYVDEQLNKLARLSRLHGADPFKINVALMSRLRPTCVELWPYIQLAMERGLLAHYPYLV